MSREQLTVLVTQTAECLLKSKLENVLRVRSSKSRWCLRFAVRDAAQAASGLDMQAQGAQGAQGAQAQGGQGQAARGHDMQEQAHKLHS